MASYRADIEIAVKGAQELKRLQDQISATAKLSDSLNNYLENIGSGGVVRSIQNLTTTVNQAATALDSAALGTQEATIAARHYVTASNALNASLKERAALVEQINLEGQSSPVTLSSPLRGRTESILKQRKGAKELSEVLADLEEQDRLLSNSKLDAKALAIQTALDAEAAAAKETAAQIKNLSDRQQEFIARTNEAAQAAAGQTAEFYRQKRIALQVAKLNETAPKAQLLLNPAAPGSPAMSGGARRQITGPVERAGGMRTQDEADTTLRWAQATKQLVQPLSQVDSILKGIAQEAKRSQSLPLLPSSQSLNAAYRGIKQLETAEDSLNTERTESVARLRELDRLEESRARRAKKLQGIADYNNPRQPVEDVAAQKKARGQRAESIALGVGFPLMFGAGPGSVAGSLAGSFVGSGFGGQILGGALGQTLDDAAKSAADFARSMREGGDAAGYLTEKLGYLNPETKALIQNAQQSGQTAKAAALAQQELANAIGGSAATDLKNYGELWDFTGRQFQKFTLLLQAGMPQIIAQTVAAATGLTGLYAVVSKLPVVAGLAGMVAPKEKPETVEAQTKTKELKEQLAVAKANYQVSLQNNTANSQGYLISKAQTIQTEKTVKYNEIIRDLEIKKISEKDKITKILALELNTTQQLRDLDKDRVQILDQRNQVVLAQQQATQQVSLIQQQVQLAREQNTASEVRKTSLQGQISIQQALNAQESISLQLNQELNKQQRDRNENKIKELQAQRSIATANVELAQQQAAQQQQQSLRNFQVSMFETTKQRLSLERDIRSVLEQHLEITGTSSEFYIAQNKNIKENYSVSKGILDLETNIALLQNPSLTEEINSAYQQRLTLLKQEYELQVAIQKLRIQTAIAERSKLVVGGELEASINQNELQNTLSTAQLGISMQGRPQAEVEKAQLLLNIQKEREQRQLQFAKGITALEADIYASSGLTRENLQIQYEQRLKNYEAENLLYNQIDAVRIKQQELNGFASTYGSLIQGIGGSIESGLVGAIDSAITGARSLQEVLSDVLKDIGKMLISFGIRSLLSGININGVSLVGRAAGGPVSSNSTYMVGEKGPELFVPRTSGTIVPADATAAAMARYQRQGGSSSGNSSSDAMGAGAAATPVLSMSFETTRFLGQDYVSTDQLQAAMMATEKRAAAAGAKAGAAQVTSKLQQSPSYRRQVGLR